MAHKIITYVFLDLETTGLPREENNKTKIMELSLVSVLRDHLLETQAGCAPRVQDKLTLCFNPQKMVNPGSTDSTGLDNDLLEPKTPFNKDVCCMIRTFLNVQPKPVCLIAQNGMDFDFPIVKKHFVKNQENLSEDVMCADCYHGFYDILEAKEDDVKEIMSRTVDDVSTTDADSPDNATVNRSHSEQPPRSDKIRRDLSKTFCEMPSSTNIINPSHNTKHVANSDQKTIQPPHKAVSNVDAPITVTLDIPSETSINDNLNELDININNIMQLQNESTPRRPTRHVLRTRTAKEIRERRFPWPQNNRPKKSYKLGQIYERVLNRPAQEAHRAENDCIFALEIAVALGNDFVNWVDSNCVPFNDIKPLTIGVKPGF